MMSKLEAAIEKLEGTVLASNSSELEDVYLGIQKEFIEAQELFSKYTEEKQGLENELEERKLQSWNDPVNRSKMIQEALSIASNH